ncbi:hypothetical protein ACGE0T_09520 [Parabacteroides sp. APC149_11_2_Y6]
MDITRLDCSAEVIFNAINGSIKMINTAKRDGSNMGFKYHKRFN